MSDLHSPIAAGRTAEIFDWKDDCILKLTRPAFPAHLADQEWHLAQAARKMGIPVPEPIELLEVKGRRGVVFRRIHGPSMLQAMESAPLRLDSFARLLANLHADLHRRNAPGFPTLHDRVRWSIPAANLLSEQQKMTVLHRLESLPQSDTLCHADFHPLNILLPASGPVIIDWEGCLRGEPAGDVAYTLLWITTGIMAIQGRRGWLQRLYGHRFQKIYLAEYQKVRGPVQHLEEWLAILAACRMNEENQGKTHVLLPLIRDVFAEW